MHRHYPFAMRAYWALISGTLLLLFSACGPKGSSIQGTTEGYNLQNAKTLQLPTVLNEISGLWYYPKDTSLFAIVDEIGFLYKIFPKHPERIYRWKFSGTGDFEDLCMVNGTFYILKSDGDIYVTTISSSQAIQSVRYQFPEKGNEFESLYYDDSLRMLVLMCKDCKTNEKETLGFFGFDPVARQYVNVPVRVDVTRIAPIVDEPSLRFKPAAATINPFTGQLYMISSVNKLLVVADRAGNVQQAYPLSKRLYKQPEGMTIGSDRTLYISNEAAGKGAPNILIIPYRPEKS